MTAPTSIIFDDSGLRIQEFSQLVLEQYGSRGWLDGNQKALPADVYDKHSDVLTVHKDDQIVAGMRIVRHSEHGFPHGDKIPLGDFAKGNAYYENPALKKLAETPVSQMAEITRLVGKRTERFLTFDLAKAIYHYAKAKDIPLYVMVIDNDFLKLCTVLGIPIHAIGPSVYCEGSMTTPAIIDPDEFPSAIGIKNKTRWNYIEQGDNLRGKYWGNLTQAH